MGSPALKPPTLTPKDLQPLIGKKWQGSLTYLDYTTKQPTSIESTLAVTPVEGKDREWTFAFGYPKEPGANSSSVVTLSADGRTFDGETIRERRRTKTGLVVVTETQGQDDNRPATLEHTYTVSQKEFSIQKRVRFDGTSEWVLRNTYRWTDAK